MVAVLQVQTVVVVQVTEVAAVAALVFTEKELAVQTLVQVEMVLLVAVDQQPTAQELMDKLNRKVETVVFLEVVAVNAVMAVQAMAVMEQFVYYGVLEGRSPVQTSQAKQANLSFNSLVHY